jgi:hypothetical protein
MYVCMYAYCDMSTFSTFPRQQIRMQQLRALLEVVFFYAVSAKVMYWEPLSKEEEPLVKAG